MREGRRGDFNKSVPFDCEHKAAADHSERTVGVRSVIVSFTLYSFLQDQEANCKQASGQTNE